MRRHTRAFAERLGVVGLINVQYAIKDGVVYVLEVNPRGSRTVPFVSKTTGVPLASLAAAVMVGPDPRRAGPAGRRAPALRRGEGGGVPLQQARRGGPRARPRDALDRRGHGHRRLVRDGVRQGADLAPTARCRSRARSSSPSTTTTRPTWSRSRGGSTGSASGSSPPRAPPATSAPAAFPPSGCSRCTRAGPTPSTSWSRARSSC